MQQAMTVLTSQATNEWYTPSGVIELARKTMGSIDLDPASCDYAQKWIKAETYYTQEINGLTLPWLGNIWLNPPFDNAPIWILKMISEFNKGNIQQGMLLVNSALGYIWYETLWRLYPVCCLRNRIRFVDQWGNVGGRAKKGQTVVYMGNNWHYFYQLWYPYGRILLPSDLSAIVIDEFIKDENNDS